MSTDRAGLSSDQSREARVVAIIMTSAGKATTTVQAVSTGTPAATAGLQAGDRIVSIDGAVVQAEDISKLISGSDGRVLTVVVVRDGRRVTLPPTAAKRTDGTYRLGFMGERTRGFAYVDVDGVLPLVEQMGATVPPDAKDTIAAVDSFILQASGDGDVSTLSGFLRLSD